MRYWEKYAEKIITLQRRFLESQAKNIDTAAEVITKSLLNDGILHLFGTGHSCIPLQEAFYRSGGLAPVDAMLDPNFGVTYGAERCSALEKIEGFATKFVLPQYDLRPGEVIIVYSTTGRNPAVVEAAFVAKEKGLFVIGVTSVDVSMENPTRHSSGKRLCEIADLVVDIDVPEGDVLLPIPDSPQLGSTGGASTMLTILFTNSVLIQVVENFTMAGKEPPTLLCPNVGDATVVMEKNRTTMDRFRARIKHA
jgi:uncharacterized phosphosugar-binding protein